jgi:hypothetical protein
MIRLLHQWWLLSLGPFRDKVHEDLQLDGMSQAKLKLELS